MHVALFTVFGLLALGLIAWSAWRERAAAGRLASTTSDWSNAIARLQMEQERENHRQVRLWILQEVRRINHHPVDSRLVLQARAELSTVLHNDPVYPRVLKVIQAACAARQEVTEPALCVALGDLLLEDIRQCMAIAQALGQIQLRQGEADTLVSAAFHPST